MSWPSAPEVHSDATHILVTILAMLEQGLSTADVAPGSSQAPDARQQWLMRRAGGHAGTSGKSPMAEELANCSQAIRSVYLDMQQQPYVIVRDNFMLAANRPCIDQVKRYSSTGNLPPVFLTRNLRGAMNLDPVEHSEHRYFPLNELPEDISPPLMPAIRKLTEEFQ